MSRTTAKSAQAPVFFRLIELDPYLKPHAGFYEHFHRQLQVTEQRITHNGKKPLTEVAAGHKYFGLHRNKDGWTFREWAPNATALHLFGTFSNWQRDNRYAAHPLGDGVWEIKVPPEALHHGDLYRMLVDWPGGTGDRIPAYVRRAVQDHQTKMFSAQIWEPEQHYQWKVKNFVRGNEPLLIYEAHIGMAQEEHKVGTYSEFRERVLPRIADAGYTALQLIGVQEHPYYGSFGYQVANFFAASSRFGTPDELKELIDAAHQAGIAVFLDLVHSHSVRNEIEGLGKLDGTSYQYFHEGWRGFHPVWDSRLFNYAKSEVLEFLLSNVRFWLEEYRFDGFRFDGVTSMLYFDHGIGVQFCSYEQYFNQNLDLESLIYLALANKTAHAVCPQAITIAEEVSGFPGLASPLHDGGVGFDYRLAMGIPDFWVETVKKKKDEEWHVAGIHYHLTDRRPHEKTISYVESHDQSLVGDQTIIFRLLKTRMYDGMRVDLKDLEIDRGLSLHRLMRLSTVACAGSGYLNFMGNEFGHPEWIDFPRDGNNWSYMYARRQWSLRDNPDLQYCWLANFDRELMWFVRRENFFNLGFPEKIHEHVHFQILGVQRGGLLFIFNFNGTRSFSDYTIPAPPGKYHMVFDSDRIDFGGNGRLRSEQVHFTLPEQNGVKVYLPTRTALVLKKID